MAGRHEEAGGGAVHLDHGVVGGRSAVHEDVELRAEVGQWRVEPAGQLGEAVHHARRLVVDRGWGLVEDDVVVGRDADEVGERPPDVDPDPIAHQRGARRSERSFSVASSSTARVRSSSEPVSITPYSRSAPAVLTYSSRTSSSTAFGCLLYTS